MRKPGDIVMVFVDPLKMEGPKGQARLKTYIYDRSPLLEEWIVEYLDQEECFYTAIIRKEEMDGENKKIG